MKSKQKTITPLIAETYLAVIKNSVGTKMFRNFFARSGGRKTDVMRGGDLSCAFYVSAVLTLFKCIKEGHCTVDSTVNDLRRSGWREVKRPRPGDVLVWAAVDFGAGEEHKHIGFYIGAGRAVSNNSRRGSPAEHDLTFGGKRKIATIFHRPKLS
ncbi:MAG: hypothetical protein HZA25_02285 [Candidatus Niyogibacteria bacterium]|nr:hypothetical protein [Candidatus Niyogibacteria bacterium]